MADSQYRRRGPDRPSPPRIHTARGCPPPPPPCPPLSPSCPAGASRVIRGMPARSTPTTSSSSSFARVIGVCGVRSAATGSPPGVHSVRRAPVHYLLTHDYVTGHNPGMVVTGHTSSEGGPPRGGTAHDESGPPRGEASRSVSIRDVAAAAGVS